MPPKEKTGGKVNYIQNKEAMCLTERQADYVYRAIEEGNMINLVEAWYPLEQYIGLKEDNLSSTTLDFIRSEGNLETKHLYWFRKPKMC